MFYKTKIKKLSGTNFQEVNKKALDFYKQIKKQTKRKPYVRSAYFNKDKIFLELFWVHLFEKENWRDRARRLRFFPCAIDLIKNTHMDPLSKENPNKKGEILHRFTGITNDKEIFIVQIKQNKRNNQKWLMSIFPSEK